MIIYKSSILVKDLFLLSEFLCFLDFSMFHHFLKLAGFRRVNRYLCTTHFISTFAYDNNCFCCDYCIRFDRIKEDEESIGFHLAPL